MLNRTASGSAPVTLRNSLLSSPLFGAARSSQAIAPRNGGVTNEAVTRSRTVRRNGMSVRATSQPIGEATAQQIRLTDVARMKVVTSGSSSGGSLISVEQLDSVNAPSLLTEL